MSDCEWFAQIAQDKWATMSESLRLFRGNERPWANPSGCSRQMRDRERFAQVTHDKWVNERLAPKSLAKKSKILFFSTFYIHKKMRIRSFPLFGERCEWIAQVAHQQWAMWANHSGRLPKMSDSLRSLRGKEGSWANRSGRSPKVSEWVNRSFFWANRSFAHFWAKNERFVWKTDEQIPSPD